MFRYREDVVPVVVLLCVFSVDVTVYAFVDAWWVLLPYGLLSLLPKAGACAFNHHHQHVSTFTHWLPNRLLELVYALTTGVSSQAWVLHHSLGHHLNYLDQTKDESRWARADGSRMGEWEYSFVTTVTAYWRAFQTGAKYPKQRRLFVVMGVLSLALVATLVWLRPVPGLILFVLVPFLALFGTAMATWTHHSGRSTASHFVACNNILQPFYNRLTGNLGYHTAHHLKPGVHWSKLPELHAEIAAQIPADAYVEPGYPWKWFGASPRPVRAEEQPPVTAG
ncbi:MAG: fatty acid desaturase [Myxococcota bacterium]